MSLSIVSEALALLSLGLVRPWGERFDDRLPLLGGRRVPPSFAITAATAGAVALTLIWAYATVNVVAGLGTEGFDFSGAWARALLFGCYLPLLLWGPLLFVLTWAYYRRRCRD